MTYQKTTSTVFALASLIALAPAHSALIVSVNFREDNGNPNQLIAPETVAGGGAGVGVSNWNDGLGASGSINDLVSDSGTTTTADIVWSSGGTWGDGTANVDADAGIGSAQLQRGYLDDNQGDPISITISEIPYLMSYDLVVYFSTDTSGDNYGEIIVTDALGSLLAATSGSKAQWAFNPALDNTNSLRVSGLMGDVTIDAPNRIGGVRHSISGIQVIGVIPELSSAVLLALSGVVLLGRRKR
jgi:hypothetical protein